MSKCLFAFMLSLSCLVGGCGDGSANAAGRPPAGDGEWHRGRWESSPRGEKLATPMPGDARGVLEKVQIEIEAAEALDEGVIEIGEGEAGHAVDGGGDSVLVPRFDHTVLALQVKVTSHHDRLRLLVGPQRFHLVTRDGVKIQPGFSHKKTPLLSETYLRGGVSIGGWLIFRVPKGQTQLTLKSDLSRPPIELPVPEWAVPGRPEEEPEEE